MSADTVSRQAQELLDKLRTIGDTIESYEALLWQLKHERLQLRAQLAATGYRPPEQPGLPL